MISVIPPHGHSFGLWPSGNPRESCLLGVEYHCLGKEPALALKAQATRCDIEGLRAEPPASARTAASAAKALVPLAPWLERGRSRSSLWFGPLNTT